MHGIILRFGDEWGRGKMIQLILLQYTIYQRSGRQVYFWGKLKMLMALHAFLSLNIVGIPQFKSVGVLFRNKKSLCE